MAAQSVCIQPASADDPPVVYNLKLLIVEHIRKLCSNVGITNCGSQNNFNCRKAIAAYFRYEDALDANGLKPTSHASRLTSTICRAINVVFSEEFIEDFKTVNDGKARKDHESKNTSKAFWIRAIKAYNSCVACDTISVTASTTPLATGTAAFMTPPAAAATVHMRESHITTTMADELYDEVDESPTTSDSFSTLVFPPYDLYLCDLVEDPEVNLLCVVQFDTEAFRKKILDLFRIRRKMKENMTVSGTHDSDPWNFVECAMAGTQGFTKVAVYYFYQRCEANSDIDSCFQPFLDTSIRGDTVSLLGDNDDEDMNGSSSKKRAAPQDEHEQQVTDSILQNVLAQGNRILKHLAGAAQECKVVASNLKKKTKFLARLEVAKALGDREELKKLMDEARAMDDSDNE
ncbi:hypothetical protein MHU86_24787 [Fragilaria crotonensis]|nr:hypothetical protein MHU86_24787 [Fragilaria crotonensis]